MENTTIDNLAKTLVSQYKTKEALFGEGGVVNTLKKHCKLR